MELFPIFLKCFFLLFVGSQIGLLVFIAFWFRKEKKERQARDERIKDYFKKWGEMNKRELEEFLARVQQRMEADRVYKFEATVEPIPRRLPRSKESGQCCIVKKNHI